MGLRRVTDVSAVEPLFEGWPERLLCSALDGCMGAIYAGEGLTAAQAVIGDFSFLAGDASCPDAPLLAAHVPEGFADDAMLIVPRDEDWAATVEAALGECAKHGERYAIRKDADRFDPNRLRAMAAALPEGFTLRPMDGDLYREALANPWSRDLVSQFAGESDFLNRGLGVMALAADGPAAGASSYAVYHGGIEVEIDTRPDCRRRGLATACGAALMLRCFERNLYPSWDAANQASVGLAEKLGYVFDRAYPIYRLKTGT